MSVDDDRLRRHPLGFLHLADPPGPEELKAYYEDRYYQTERGNYRKSYSDAERAVFDLKVSQRASLVDSIRESAEPGSMLDVGCGEGFALAWFRGRGWQVEGLDYSRAGIEAMNPELARNVDTGDLFELLRGRMEDGRRYDLVWLSNVLEHVADPVGLLGTLRELVSADGVLVVTVPNDGSAFQETLLEHGDIPHRFWIAIPDHLAYFTRESLVAVAEATGWSCEDVIADFPIDLYLLHGESNYVRDASRGPAAHAARISVELLLGRHPAESVNDFYRSLARVGLGRNLTAFLRART